MNPPPLEACPLRWRARHQPERPAIFLDQQTLSYRKLDQLVSGCCRRLQPFSEGSCVAAVGRNSLELILLQLASLRLGFQLLALSHRQPLEVLLKVLHEHQVVAVWLGDDAPDVSGCSLPCTRLNLDSLEEGTVETSDCLLQPEQPCTRLQTSGSSGSPKWVVHAYRAHYFSAQGSEGLIALNPGDRWLLSLPLFHIGGQAIVWRCLIAGAALVLSERPQLELLREGRVTHLSLVNTQLYRLLESGTDWACTSLKVLLLGGSAIAPRLVEQLADLPLQVLTSYGLTELASQVCTGAPLVSEGQLCSGALLAPCEIKLGLRGQILLRGKTLMLGYFKEGGITPAQDPEGWFASGDCGYWYQGQLFICGRIDNQMISGGENIQPEEIEKILLNHPEVAQVAVVAIPDAEYGQRPVVFLRMQSGTVNAIKWPVLLAGKLASFKVPDFFWDWPQQANSGLKVNRRQLEKLALRYRDAARLKAKKP